MGINAGRATQRRKHTRPVVSDPSIAGAPSRRSRTPPPSPIPGELEEINLGAGRERKKSRGRASEDKIRRFQNLQQYLHNPGLFDLRGKILDTSSTPDEIEARTGEVRYQIEILRSLLAVLTEELEGLQNAQSQLTKFASQP
jgi:hypothetical protein